MKVSRRRIHSRHKTSNVGNYDYHFLHVIAVFTSGRHQRDLKRSQNRTEQNKYFNTLKLLQFIVTLHTYTTITMLVIKQGLFTMDELLWYYISTHTTTITHFNIILTYKLGLVET